MNPAVWPWIVTLGLVGMTVRAGLLARGPEVVIVYLVAAVGIVVAWTLYAALA
jgi:hypothetical protein